MSGSFGPKFAPNEVFIRWGWDRIMATTDLPQAVSEPIYAGWRDAFVGGDPRRERNALRDGLADQEFRWLWLERSFDWIKRVIEPVHGWPYTWRTPRRKILRLPKSKVDLLGGDLGGMVYQARDRTNYARLRQSKWPAVRTDEVVLVAEWGCLAENAIARLFVDRFAAGDGTAWPPYFPGDRTTVRFEVHGGHKYTSAGEIARCPAALVEPLWPISANMPFPALP